MQKNHDKTMMKETPIKMHTKPARYRLTFNELHIVNTNLFISIYELRKGYLGTKRHFDKVFVSGFWRRATSYGASLIKLKISLSNSLLMSFVWIGAISEHWALRSIHIVCCEVCVIVVSPRVFVTIFEFY